MTVKDETEQWKVYLFFFLGTGFSVRLDLAAVICFAAGSHLLSLQHPDLQTWQERILLCGWARVQWACARAGASDDVGVKDWQLHAGKWLSMWVVSVCVFTLCVTDLFEQPAGSQQHGYIRPEWRPSKRKQKGRQISLHLSYLIHLSSTIRQEFLHITVFVVRCQTGVCVHPCVFGEVMSRCLTKRFD